MITSVADVKLNAYRIMTGSGRQPGSFPTHTHKRFYNFLFIILIEHMLVKTVIVCVPNEKVTTVNSTLSDKI